ncbi:MAG: Holliday junction branch migration protein RuvA [Candidatus Harrisonbacteria bacterium CG10_big_fil_rev_8_21_14_0_10_40_38]|uniref:Holliday junction branch migration complex subunit RuvA n=1 Tax=Candidatus Harrisonbacteria bacterium CG10_big_fil_rev_8_21_14_0_10_40_38 TaxID=1974583 RepID=A0A2H0URC0_9BACT|nr:MAG: Holliday junction branch migration protein RuvA [Candidatus Harrisonbacteria bacterium CG10_big_fil_rev_8_21_14_0_10_40_38]
MIQALSGTLIAKRPSKLIVDIGPVAFGVYVSENVLANSPEIGSKIKLFSYLHVREDALELYGFLDERELDLFKKLHGISGIGPKSALSILGVAPIEQLVSAINVGKADLLSRASGVGKKTAERIVLELKGKLSFQSSAEALNIFESDVELEETLVGLGYTRAHVKMVISKIDPSVSGFKDRLKEALKNMKTMP